MASAMVVSDPASVLPPSDSQDGAPLSFEAALRALEGIVQRLESGEVPLDDSISLYEEGERLRRHCQARLDAARERIERIVGAEAKAALTTRPFDAPGS